jgi:hypothetical protein
MTTIEEYVIYNPQYKVLICYEHGYAMKPSFIKPHLQLIHKATSLYVRQSIMEYSNGLKLIAAEDLETPEDTTPYAVREDGVLPAIFVRKYGVLLSIWLPIGGTLRG